MTNTEVRTSQLWEDEGIVQPSSMVAQPKKREEKKKIQWLSGSTVPEGDNNNTAACQYISHTCVRVCVFVPTPSLVTHVRRAALLFLAHDRHPEICKTGRLFLRSPARPPARRRRRLPARSNTTRSATSFTAFASSSLARKHGNRN